MLSCYGRFNATGSPIPWVAEDGLAYNIAGLIGTFIPAIVGIILLLIAAKIASKKAEAEEETDADAPTGTEEQE